MAGVTGNKPHVLAVPLPAQGHVKPLMNLCRQIAKHGIKVTLVNAESIHNKIAAAAEEEEDDNIVFATVPDGLTADDDPNNPFTLMGSLPNTMPQSLTDLIHRINSSNPYQKISCVIADLTLSWIFDIAEKMGAQLVGFSSPSAACMAMIIHTLNLLEEEGNLDTKGSLTNGDVITLSDDIPAWRREELPWSISVDTETERVIFEMAKQYREANKVKWNLTNTCYELEPAAAEFLPNVLPVGPLHLLDSNAAASPGNFYREDASCLSWLDNKPDGSVIYVSFGSLAVFSQQQLGELALGLELSGRAFLWVTRPDLGNGSQVVYPDGFLERVGELGKIVEWAPQDKVLSHTSIYCFVSHCGWNSTIEGLSLGVPFLCWSHFFDQLYNERYICEKWEIGLKISVDEEGIRSRHEIKKKIDMLFFDNKYKKNALKLKEVCAKSVSDGGSSYRNLEKFINHLRE
ncbi:hypothetical protein C2S52_008315 [Perilla frutescens var. hirtella]|nr:hypothetical protein C2S52_008315 [Perilla frutescens var. hirtella]